MANLCNRTRAAVCLGSSWEKSLVSFPFFILDRNMHRTQNTFIDMIASVVAFAWIGVWNGCCTMTSIHAWNIIYQSSTMIRRSQTIRTYSRMHSLIVPNSINLPQCVSTTIYKRNMDWWHKAILSTAFATMMTILQNTVWIWKRERRRFPWFIFEFSIPTFPQIFTISRSLRFVLDLWLSSCCRHYTTYTWNTEICHTCVIESIINDLLEAEVSLKATSHKFLKHAKQLSCGQVHVSCIESFDRTLSQNTSDKINHSSI